MFQNTLEHESSVCSQLVVSLQA
ncbi:MULTISPECIES: hypothetical protein [Vibrio]